MLAPHSGGLVEPKIPHCDRVTLSAQIKGADAAAELSTSEEQPARTASGLDGSQYLWN